MNLDLQTLMKTVNAIDLILAFILIATVGGILFAKRKKIVEVLEHWRKKRNFEDNIIKIVNELRKNDETLQKNIDKLWEVVTESKEVSKGIRSDMRQDIKNVSADVKLLIQTVEHIKEQSRSSKRADLKEKIERIYRECSEKQVCTDIAFDTLRDLIESYENNGGKNSFVHSLVEPEMYKWKRIKLTPNENQNGFSEE